MLRLALETATSPGSVALAEDERLLVESVLPVRATRSEVVLPEVARLLAACDRRPQELGQVVVGAGPGSFTGVRIAAALAKGLRFARETELMAYPSLAVAAAGTGLEGRVCAAFDARRGEVYAAAYRRLAPPEAVLGPAALPMVELLERLQPVDAWTFVGEGAWRHEDRILALGGRVLPAHLGIPRAATLLWLAHRFPEAGRVAAPSEWEPAYLRRPAAERFAEGRADGASSGVRG